MRVFFDSSALAKRYVVEAGTDRVLELGATADEVIVCVLCVPEVISAFNRLRRERKLDDDQYGHLKHELAADIAEASVIDLAPQVLATAVTCLERFPTRSLDALHVACAARCGCDLFVSADARQSAAAEGFGLQVETVG
jgi:predicted nucleic acid-binding protein